MLACAAETGSPGVVVRRSRSSLSRGPALAAAVVVVVAVVVRSRRYAGVAGVSCLGGPVVCLG